MGRRRRFRLIHDRNKKDIVKEGFAMIPQSTASDINLMASNDLRLKHGLGVRMLVHDSTLVECPQGEAEDIKHLTMKVMSEIATERFDDFIDFPTEGKIGNTWATV
jgi:DNA polymerase I-like protein with 3'-5' exonuclease and polymerase domains